MVTSQMNTPPEPEVTFARDLGFFDATMIGIGAMIGAGIFVLTDRHSRRRSRTRCVAGIRPKRPGNPADGTRICRTGLGLP